ncbi:hypothetical protein [Roseomonas marmotae]|uniref:Outer membrane protein assembly factor BamE n=1 Tax=Roseomonas marmotae TaxID=2768161 RepID=A0ABS3KDX2_9PROT|nr:hypothetical protein [Roseomonas marmotae]MBO1075676.1 hypothetical protein [Roseomonas marmotae]QTI79534.1 hypothetical protein IAI58_01530 [Roseomonas marmotae]
MPCTPLLPLLLACLLAACAQDPALERQAVLDEVLASYRANLAGMRPLNAPLVAREGDMEASMVAMPALSGVPTQAAQLLGQPPAALLRLLGAPRLRRQEGDAEIWLYQSPFCHLDVMFYRDSGRAGTAPAGSGLRVTYATARAAGAERRTEAACLQELAGLRQS